MVECGGLDTEPRRGEGASSKAMLREEFFDKVYFDQKMTTGADKLTLLRGNL